MAAPRSGVLSLTGGPVRRHQLCAGPGKPANDRL